jgi:hypothetical protein
MRTTSHGSARIRRVPTLGGAVVLAMLGVTAIGTPAQAAPATSGQIYVINAVAGTSADLAVDGAVVQAAAAPKSIVGPLTLPAGAHVVSFNVTGQPPLTASVDVTAGGSSDVVAHQSVDPADGAKFTVFPNDLSAVAPGKARLVVAHTAVVPPADVRVDGTVLFSNVANGEALTLVVPGGTYNVDIVPASTTGPVVFGPVELAVAPDQLNRVYAFGDPGHASMDAIVRTQPLPVEGAGLPGSVQTGNGGQAAAMAAGATEVGDATLPGALSIGLAAVLGVAGILALRAGRRRRIDH